MPRVFWNKTSVALVSVRGQWGELLSICALQDRSAFFSCLLKIHFLPERSLLIFLAFWSSLSHQLRNLQGLFGVNRSSRLSYQFLEAKVNLNIMNPILRQWNFTSTLAYTKILIFCLLLELNLWDRQFSKISPYVVIWGTYH